MAVRPARAMHRCVPLPLGVIPGRELDGIAGIADLDEAHAFDDPARVHVEARDHPDCEHAAIPSSIVKRPS